MGRKGDRFKRDQPPNGPIEPSGPRLWMQPWMKWTGMSLWAGVITWFRLPKGERRVTLSAAFVAMGVFAVILAIGAALLWILARLI